MPKQTFLNLEAGKKQQITEAFLREFAIKPFDEASITVVVKQLGIAKGSIYQYFEDKLELFMYLMGECALKKKQYVEGIHRNDYPDFWTYFRNLYEYGFTFDHENPLQSHFLHNLTQNLNSPSIRMIYDQMLDQVVSSFKEMVKLEVELGLFRNDISIDTMGFMLYKIGVSIQEQLTYTGVINPKESIEKKLPVFWKKKPALMQVVDEYILLAKPAFNKKLSV